MGASKDWNLCDIAPAKMIFLSRTISSHNLRLIFPHLKVGGFAALFGKTTETIMLILAGGLATTLNRFRDDGNGYLDLYAGSCERS